MQAQASHRISSRLTTGRLEGISVPDLFWSLCTARATGVLHLSSKGITKKVYFSAGLITFAASGDPNDRLGEMLLRQGTIRLDHLERAISRLPEGKRLGTILVEAGHLAPENLIRAVLDQVRHIVMSLFAWEEGEYTFDEGPLPTDEVVTLNMKTGSILLHGIRSIRSFSRIRRSVGSPRTRFQAVEGWREAAEGLELSDGERQMLARLEGEGESVDRLCRGVFLSNFEIYQALWAFKVLGLLRERERTTDVSESGFLTEGRFDRDGLAGLLVRLARAAETGVFHVARGSAERTFHVREGRIVFATSNNIDDGLVAYLLRRGMISLRDREETAKRLLSNKRVGHILLEMGVIDEPELAKLVREHLCEILFDTFRWEDGDWIWASGELPTIEGITLDRSIEDIVFAGVRRVTSWPRVREGCGGLATRLELTPQYLQILDRMTVATDDWELITSLRVPKTPLELCRSVALGDFRVCQTLWALRLLGAVDEAPLDDALDAALGSMGTMSGAEPADREAMVAPEREPEPIAPAEVAAGESFEVTTVVEMTPDAPPSEQTVPASSWSEPEEDRAAPWAWRPAEDAPGVEVSRADEGAELISEPWRLLGDEVRPPVPPAEPAAPTAVEARDAEPAPTAPESDSFTMLPEAEVPRGSGFEMGVPGSGVAALFEVPAPELGGRHDFEMDLPGARLEPSPEAPPDEASFADLNDPEPEPAPGPAAEALFDAPDGEGGEAPPSIPTYEEVAREATGFPETLASREERSSEALDRTARIPREDIEAALHGAVPADGDISESPAPEVPSEASSWIPDPPAAPEQAPEAEPAPVAPVEPPWDAPADLDGEIARFVARHKAVYRVIRSEVGAGAANFVRSCRVAVGNGLSDLLGGADMQPDGAWDAGELRRLVCERRLAEAPEGFRRLIEHEVATLRAQIGERRAQALVEQIEKL